MAKFYPNRRKLKEDENVMNSTKTSICTIVSILVVTLTTPLRLAAQGHPFAQNGEGKPRYYQLIDLGTFGGPNVGLAVEPIAQILNNQGVAVGEANTGMLNPYYPNVNPFLGLGTNVGHAFAWQNGVLTDLGTLPGGVDSGAGWINRNGLIAGVSENGEMDPLLGVPQGIAVLWYHGKIINLGTLDGGYESVANSVNIWGQVTGPALNTVPDPYSMLGLGTQTRAFIWEEGVIRDLGTLGGPDAFALYINDLGQVAGSSYTNSTPNAATGLPTQDPFVWDHGKMLDLGTLGGVFGSSNALNNHGEVAGQSDVTGDQSFHAFLWSYQRKMQDLGTFGGNFSTANWLNDNGEIVGWSTFAGDQVLHASDWNNGVMTDLGALGDFPCSVALAINSSGQIVGQVDDCISISHAALWEKGRLIDLNIFVPTGSGILLEDADYINDRGEIIGYALLPNGNEHAFLLVPCDENHPGVEGCDYSTVDASTAPSPLTPHEAPRHMPPTALWRRNNRFHLPALGPANGAFSQKPVPPLAVSTPLAEDIGPAEKPRIAREVSGEAGRSAQREADGEISSCSRAERGASNSEVPALGYVVHGECSVNENASTLTGYCQGPILFAHNCSGGKDASQCPSGQKAKEPEWVTCGNFALIRVDVKRPCEFVFK